LEAFLEGNSCLLLGGAPDSPVHHRTSTVHGPVRISFLKWHNRPLQNCSRWRTRHCPVHTGQSGAHRTVRCPQSTVGWGHASHADCTADRCAGGRWLTGQFGAPPDSPVNYSRTPQKISREWPVRRSPAWRTGHCPVLHQTVRCARLSYSWLYTANSFPILFFS
jgi:hypothetical protein